MKYKRIAVSSSTTPCSGDTNSTRMSPRGSAMRVALPDDACHQCAHRRASCYAGSQTTLPIRSHASAALHRNGKRNPACRALRAAGPWAAKPESRGKMRALPQPRQLADYRAIVPAPCAVERTQAAAASDTTFSASRTCTGRSTASRLLAHITAAVLRPLGAI